MGRRKNENIRKIQQSHGTYYLSIPIGFMRKLNWREHQKVVMELTRNNRIVIKDWKKK